VLVLQHLGDLRYEVSGRLHTHRTKSGDRLDGADGYRGTPERSGSLKGTDVSQNASASAGVEPSHSHGAGSSPNAART